MSLKKALLKAGVVTQDQIRVVEKEALAKKQAAQKALQAKSKGPQRKPRPKAVPEKPVEKKHAHHARSLCEHCGKNSPDVEFYRHTNKALDKYWLCIKCADEYSIHDDLRQTAQSFHSMTGVFRREYGPTQEMAPGHGAGALPEKGKQ